ncbi:MAG TPA: class I SAM-dependent rRNA methyltransferase [Nevskiaceae bacterium]|nr:class I SAM-dependent rRNA methyltransferase [Nevskiaceae bacterium]
MLTLRLKANEDRRLRAGHLWVYSNEIDTRENYRQIEPGSLCRLEDARGKPLGLGYVNPQALLAVRLLSGKADAQIDSAWFQRRLASALALRERLYPGPYYRLVHGESDGLPGIVIDRYGEVLAIQLTTAGAERLRAPLVAALHALLRPRGLVFRHDSSSREAEGLSSTVEVEGEVPARVRIEEGGVAFEVDPREGQKTGWFYDQADNRERLRRYVRGARVLDVFSYAGAWALRAAAFGAAAVTAVDRSAAALDSARHNAALNGRELETLEGEALDRLRELRAAGRQFEVVVVDPPALIKKRKDHAAGLAHYGALNRAALQLLAPDGVLVSCSCSHHLADDELQRVLLREARAVGRRAALLEQGGQGPDHPVHPAIPETRYLKAFILRAVQG